MTPEELRELIRRRVDSNWRSRTAFAREVGINYPNFNEYLNASPRAGAKKKKTKGPGRPRTITADTLLKIAPVIGLTISVSDKPVGGSEVQETRPEPPMQDHPAPTPQPRGSQHGGAIPTSTEGLTRLVAERAADAAALAATEAIERVGRQIGTDVAAALARLAPAHASVPPAPRAARRRGSRR